MRVTTEHLDGTAASTVAAKLTVAAASASGAPVAAGLRPTGAALTGYYAVVHTIDGQIATALGALTADTESSSKAYTTTDNNAANTVTRSV